MDPRTVEINNLRILNDYLNQTIEAMARAQRVGGVGQFATNGLSHSPYGVSPFGGAFGASAFGVDPHAAAYNPYFSQLSPFGVGASISQPYASMIDPFHVQRGLQHTAQLGSPWGQWNPIAELMRQQQQLQALAGYRGWGVSV
jgi:hypothetical protein